MSPFWFVLEGGRGSLTDQSIFHGLLQLFPILLLETLCAYHIYVDKQVSAEFSVIFERLTLGLMFEGDIPPNAFIAVSTLAHRILEPS